jgi:hypothetical protein
MDIRIFNSILHYLYKFALPYRMFLEITIQLRQPHCTQGRHYVRNVYVIHLTVVAIY